MAIVKHSWDETTKSYVQSQVLYVGQVIEVYKQDYRAMSDIYTLATYAKVWCKETNCPKEVFVNANFELDMTGNYADADADEETRIRFQIWNIEREIARDIESEKESLRLAAIEANRPEKGKRMKVVRGRKVKPGTEGVVFWIRDGRVGLDVTGKRDAKGNVVDPVWVTQDYLVAV